MAKADYHVVLESFHTDGELYRQGEIVDSSDPVFHKSPHLFGPIELRPHKAKAKTEAEPEPSKEPEPEKPAGKAVSVSSMKGRA